MEKKISGVNEMALVLQKRMGQVSESPMVLDFGEINTDWSLRTNSYPIDIPVNDYLVCDSLLEHDCVCDPANCVCGTAEEPLYLSHIHQVRVKQRFKPGIRVLVAWVGNDAVVVDIIRPAAEGL